MHYPLYLFFYLVLLHIFGYVEKKLLDSFERYWDKLSGGTINFEILPLLGELYNFLKFS
jgi:hypothetical protein